MAQPHYLPPALPPGPAAMARAIIRLEDEGREGDDLMSAFLAEFPGATFAEVERAAKIAAFDREQVDEEHEASSALAAVIVAFVESRGEQESGEEIGEILRRHAGRGDAEAAELLAVVAGPGARAGWALILAGAERHPDWETNGRSVSFVGSDARGDDTAALVEWFQKTHPAEARAVVDAAKGGE